MPQPPQGASADDGGTIPAKPQAAWGAWIVIAGLLAITTIFGLALLRFSKAADVATAIGAVSGVIAALVGAYFGIRGATLAQSQAMAMMTTASKTTIGTSLDTTSPVAGPTGAASSVVTPVAKAGPDFVFEGIPPIEEPNG